MRSSSSDGNFINKSIGSPIELHDCTLGRNLAILYTYRTDVTYGASANMINAGRTWMFLSFLLVAPSGLWPPLWQDEVQQSSIISFNLPVSIIQIGSRSSVPHRDVVLPATKGQIKKKSHMYVHSRVPGYKAKPRTASHIRIKWTIETPRLFLINGIRNSGQPTCAGVLHSGGMSYQLKLIYTDVFWSWRIKHPKHQPSRFSFLLCEIFSKVTMLLLKRWCSLRHSNYNDPVSTRYVRWCSTI